MRHCKFDGLDLRYAKLMVALVRSRLTPGNAASGLTAFHVHKCRFAPLQMDTANVESNIKFMSEVRRTIEDGFDAARYRLIWM